MKQSEIRFSIELDEQNIPDKIFWEASDSPVDSLAEAKAVSLSIWDWKNLETLRIDLWTKDMPEDEMKRFVVDTIGGLASTVRNATGDEYMATAMDNLCVKLVNYLKKQEGLHENE